ncbi:MAG TPA: hypothetical protein VFE17_00090 [Candidatus Baltobacteraceae bacterium]|nr:hypothetical protein [Candidatus Baltobacteraceae bacterium]
MNVIDLPRAENHAIYDAAVTQYAAYVRGRAEAVYRIGCTAYPGLSTIDVLVIARRGGIRTRHYFSALHRLPKRLAALFVHEPFIVPIDAVRVIEHARPGLCTLLAGRDVLHTIAPFQHSDERWCRALESYCQYSSFVARTQETQTLPGRLTVSLSLQFIDVLRQNASLTGGASDALAYAAACATLAAEAFVNDDGTAAVIAYWKLLRAAFAQFEERLHQHLACDHGALTPATARLLLQGEIVTEAFDAQYAFRRWQQIERYTAQLAAMGLPYGQLFAQQAYPKPARRVTGAPARNETEPLLRA